jgi:uncharacterized protein YjbI with pentapeptide repeats
VERLNTDSPAGDSAPYPNLAAGVSFGAFAVGANFVGASFVGANFVGANSDAHNPDKPWSKLI